MKRKIIKAIPPFRKEEIAEAELILKQVFRNSKHNCEIIILHDCKNPNCRLGTVHGIIGTEEDELMIINFAISEVEKDERDMDLIMKDLMKLPKSKLIELQKQN